MSNVIECRDLSKSYHEKIIHVDVFEKINFYVKPGELVSVVGQSGSGKSTLLHLLGGLDKPSSGDVLWNGEFIAKHSQAALSRLRNKTLGFVYQFHHLLPEFSAMENVAMPLLIGGMKPRQAREKAESVLVQVGLSERLKHRIAEMSGGERQRTAIARALVTEPNCVLADEPTGNLDKKTAAKVFDVMLELQATFNTSFVMVTHDLDMAKKTGRVYHVENGKLFEG